jgi:DNA-binding transcriptional LysR family regulator
MSSAEPERSWSEHSLRIFDVAVRHGSLSAAGRALGLGQPAVSHAVARLETAIGGPLLVRSSGGVTPTAIGRRLHDEVGPALAAIDGAVAEAMGRQRKRAVTVSVSTSLASYWLMPRLPDFKAANPDIELRLITSDSDGTVGTDDADLWIPLGRVSRSGLDSVLFCPERVVPVASPEVASALASVDGSIELQQAPLLHLEERYAPRFSWERWFQHSDIEAPSYDAGHREAYRSNDYSVVLQAAIAGQGVALGWLHIVSGLINDGRLVPIGEPIESDQPFEILFRSHTPMRAPVMAMRRWLQSEMLQQHPSS